MLKEDKTPERVARHKKTQEDFTPRSVVEMLYQGAEELYTNFDLTLCDPAAGTGNILIFCLEKRLENCKNYNDVKRSISSIYGTELMEDNTLELRQRLLDYIKNNFKKLKEAQYNELASIIEHNIACTDFRDWDYENWRSLKPEPVGLF